MLAFYRVGSQPQGSKVAYYLGIIENTKDKQGTKLGIPLDHTDLFKIACVIKEAAMALLGWRNDTQERKAREAGQDNDPSTSSQKAPASKKEEIF